MALLYNVSAKHLFIQISALTQKFNTQENECYLGISLPFSKKLFIIFAFLKMYSSTYLLEMRTRALTLAYTMDQTGDLIF